MASRRTRIGIAAVSVAGLIAAAVVAAPVAAAPGRSAGPAMSGPLRWYLVVPQATSALQGESQVTATPSAGTTATTALTIPLERWSWDLNGGGLTIGSQGSGASAGKATQIGTLTVTRQFDATSPLLFEQGASGKVISKVYLEGQQQSQPGAAPTTVIQIDLGLVAVQNLQWSASNGGAGIPQEVVTLSFDAMQVQYDGTATSTGSPVSSGSWNRIYNNNQFLTTPAG